MKHLLVILFITINLSLTPSVFSLNNNESNSMVIIDTFSEDITGDGKQETITLKGTLLSKDSDYYHNIWIDITNEYFGSKRINYGGGYQPKLQIIDFNFNYNPTLLFTSSSDKDITTFKHKIHSVKHNQVIESQLPIPNRTTGTLKANFEVEINKPSSNTPILFSIRDNKERFIKNGIYNANGKLNTNKRITASPQSLFTPFFISKSKGYGLKGYQHLVNVDNERIGTLETIWYFENNKWIIIQESVIDV